jgi:16S rRNA (guanine1207-N2)-methyltransferase
MEIRAPYPQEAILIEVVGEMAGERVLCTSPGLAQFAGTAAASLPLAQVTCTYLDLFRANRAREYWRGGPPNLRIECAPDLPEGTHDVIVLPFSAGGEAELTRELLQAGHERLKLGGRLYASTENRKDAWLGDVLSRLFRKRERRVLDSGVFYVGTKTEPLKKIKNFSCEFAFRDRGRLIRAVSRPGVFSHRRIDPGARRLIDETEIEPSARVLDIGCGSGVVALAIACRSSDAAVHAVDSNARAVECTLRGAQLNELTNVTAELNADGRFADAGTYDLALANPPYYANFRIAEHFLTAGCNALRPGGTMLVVTKLPEWYRDNMPKWFRDVAIAERKGYYTVRARRPENR